MLSGMLGRKVGMTQIFGENGAVIPVTIIEAGPCTVTQVKTEANDGYEAVQLGFDTIKLKHTTRPMLGHLGHDLKPTDRQRREQQKASAKARQAARQKKATEAEADQAEAGASTTAPATKGGSKRRGGARKELGPFAVLREVRVVGEIPAVGDMVSVDMFAVGEEVDIIGTSKGKGFGGVMKRHGFHGGQRTHGQSDRARAPGSIGPGTTPGRVYKGTRMAGRLGGDRVTVKALRVVQADSERNLLVVYGSVPGANGGLLMIRKSAVQMAVAARQRG
jgi:large subunit ribosomal protein L3